MSTLGMNTTFGKVGFTTIKILAFYCGATISRQVGTFGMRSTRIPSIVEAVQKDQFIRRATVSF